MSTRTLKGSISAGVQLGGQINGRKNLGGQMNVPQTFGSNDHTKLTGRDAPDQHPVEAIEDLERILAGKANTEDCEALTNSEIEELINLFV